MAETSADRFMKIYIDISNMLGISFISGIQRVEREIISRMLEYKNADIVLIAYSPSVNAFRIVDSEQFIRVYKNGSQDHTQLVTKKVLQYDEIPSGSIFFDLDNVWKSRLKRSYLYPILKKSGVKIVTHVYDIIPTQHPQYCDVTTVFQFIAYIGAALQYADMIITSTNANLHAMAELCGKIGIAPPKTVVVGLGCDYSGENTDDEDNEDITDEIRDIASSRYILSVGTIEPRKNHKLIVDALDGGLADLDVKFVFAGRFGWNVANLERRIRGHKLFGDKLVFVQRPSDAVVNYLYKHAYAVAFPTFNEGFGLPVIEAYQHNCPVIASDIEVLREVGGSYAEYFNPNDKNDFTRCVSELLENEQRYTAIKNGIAQYVPYTWDESAKAMFEALSELENSTVLCGR